MLLENMPDLDVLGLICCFASIDEAFSLQTFQQKSFFSPIAEAR